MSTEQSSASIKEAPQATDDVENKIRAKLQDLGIAFERHAHQSIMTAAEGIEISRRTGGLCMKNLFLQAKKEKRFYLLMQPGDKRLSFKALEKELGLKHLQFGSPDDLQRLLCTYPGAVTCLGLLFDAAGEVEVLVDSALEGVRLVDCHPCRNDVSYTIAFEDILQKWLPATGHGAYRWVGAD